MLILTADAEEAIRTALEAAEAPGSAGLRISTAVHASNGTGPEVSLELVDAPATEDAVLDRHGARIFVAPEVAPRLEDKLLDAEIEPDGEVQFALHNQV